MDKIITYKYALGNPSDLREGNFEKMLSSDNLKDFNLARKRKSKDLVLPEFIGVYQQENFIFHNYDESIHKQEIEDQYKEFNDFLHHQSNHLLAVKFGQEDKINPDLIHVIYNKDNGWTKTLVKECLKDSIGRLVLSNSSSSPDFGRKNTSTCYSMMIEEMKKTGQDMASYLLKNQSKLKEALDTASKFGLTREEYVFMELLRDASKQEKSNEEIIDNLLLLGLTESLIEHFPDSPFLDD
ncbi:hypothetical protein GF378_03200 [Candidatus Pacearchaeota archaeon]|nr:hypothetical protein [Candidatus Pacearchaeota archaeon]